MIFYDETDHIDPKVWESMLNKSDYGKYHMFSTSKGKSVFFERAFKYLNDNLARTETVPTGKEK